MITLTVERTLQETLGNLEFVLRTPLVPYEIGVWVHDVHQALATLGTKLVTYFRTVLDVQYAKILEREPDLATSIGYLVEGNQRLVMELANFHDVWFAFRKHVARYSELGLHEELIVSARRVREEGLSLVHNIQRQQKLATNWVTPNS